MDGIQLQSLPVYIQVLSVKQDANITRLIQQTEMNKPLATQFNECYSEDLKIMIDASYHNLGLFFNKAYK